MSNKILNFLLNFEYIISHLIATSQYLSAKRLTYALQHTPLAAMHCKRETDLKASKILHLGRQWPISPQQYFGKSSVCRMGIYDALWYRICKKSITFHIKCYVNDSGIYLSLPLICSSAKAKGVINGGRIPFISTADQLG